MTMPIDLVLVRHGQSEGNLANRASRRGDDSHFTEEFKHRHNSKFRLTDKGIAQAKSAGEWLRKNIQKEFHRFYVSEYLRAMETAALLELPQAQWYSEIYLRERDWGTMDNMSIPERDAEFSRIMKRRDIEGFYWHPNDGESMADLCLRIDRVLNTLHRECTDKRVIIVCHGEVMWAIRMRLERITTERYAELDESDKPFDHIHNCQIIHYTREPAIVLEKNPDFRNSRDYALSPNYQLMRSICPWDTTLSPNIWMPIVRQRFTNNGLMDRVNTTKRLIPG